MWKLQREPLTGVLRARVEEPLASFYQLAAAELRTKESEIMRPILRSGVQQLLESKPELKRNAQLLALANAI